MSQAFERPTHVGQLVWCPADPALGVGVVTGIQQALVQVRFWRLQEERHYTTRGPDAAIARYRIRQGERVRHRAGHSARVAGEADAATAMADDQVDDWADDAVRLLAYALDDGSVALERDLVPEVRDVGAKERLASLHLVHPEVVRARMRGLALGRLGARPGYAGVLGARAQWLPHQIDVASRAVGEDPVRLLLADEVGLGKTVEAALIYAGLRQEGRAARVLVLTPQALTIQWLGELYRKAHELFVLLDPQRVEDAQQDFPDLGPFEGYQRIVAPLPLVAGASTLAAQAAAADWDLVIVDEAHHLRWRPDGESNPAYALVEKLAAKTRHLLLLTATPMALDPAEYHALLRLLDPLRFDDPALFGSVAQRANTIRDLARTVVEAVEAGASLSGDALAQAKTILSDDNDDLACVQALEETPLSDAQGREAAAQAVVDVLRQRHALSDLVVRNRRGPVGGLPERRAQVIPLEPTEVQEGLLEAGESVLIELASGQENPARGREMLGAALRALWATPAAIEPILESHAPQLAQMLASDVQAVVQAPLDSDGLPTGDARLRWLVQTIRKLPQGEKLLVFVESAVSVQMLKPVLEHLLGGQGKLAVFHRRLAPRDQDRQVAWFRAKDGPQVMLCTEAGGEGRNFQFCHRVVLYDMPWRPATVEQRIGRVDRVGQKYDVQVLVPCFTGGYESAVLKVMQDSIGVLDQTVGGIDHALEYVSDQLADLILTGDEGDGWRGLYEQTSTLVKQARERIAAGVDPILDHASFSPERAGAVLDSVPLDLEAQVEAFVQGFADHSKLKLHAKTDGLVAVDGAPGASGQTDDSYVGTFSRAVALDYEDVEFLSFGHPLMQQALEWARDSHDASAGLAVLRGAAQDGAVFIWRFLMDLPDDVREAVAYFETPELTFALDEAGTRARQFDDLLERDDVPLDRMSSKPLKAMAERWRALVEANYKHAAKQAERASQVAVEGALSRLTRALEERERRLARAQSREVAGLTEGPALDAVLQRQETQREAFAQERERLETAIANAQPRLLAAVAVRLMRARSVSA